MADALLQQLYAELDLVVIERQPNHTFFPLTAGPSWFTRAFDGAAVGERNTLSGAFPFLDDFVQHALGAWEAGPHASLVSGPFAVDVDGEELLLRATALTVAGRTLLVLERLKGAADTRPMLQKARARMLEGEALTRQVTTLHAPAAAIERAMGELRGTTLSADQHRLVDEISTAAARLRDALATLPAPPARARR